MGVIVEVSRRHDNVVVLDAALWRRFAGKVRRGGALRIRKRAA